VFSVNDAVSLDISVNLILDIALIIQYRKHIQWKLLPAPVIFSSLSTFASVYLAAHIDAALLKPFLGVFFILLAAYFIIFSSRIHLRPNLPLAAGLSLLAGFTGGLFSINGPPLVIYFINVTPSLAAYLGTLQAFFTVNGLYTTGLRIANGLFSTRLVPFVAAGMLACLAGLFFGTKLATRVNPNVVKRIVYAIIIVSGIEMLVTGLLALR
jgi:uncharacterized membrane protein YfcA